MDSKAIFTSSSGLQYDTLATYRKLLIQSQNKINDLLSDWQSATDPLAAAVAEEALVEIARKAFDLKPFSDPAGVTDQVVLDTLTDYLGHVEGKG
ncbi:unnamed protein product [Gemmata massiliana]|uniref:Uncharacterized protein n=1 Tax=Gemmata massiliana TaxID=1210884 RepID=A0A6P2CT82_9BACT|nr:hypothetical protein [Gemmata massiliana]VTR92149.1 unnamed protein product [Gemmata massiliana]